MRTVGILAASAVVAVAFVVIEVLRQFVAAFEDEDDARY